MFLKRAFHSNLSDNILESLWDCIYNTYLIGKIIVHIVHLENRQEVVLGNSLINDSKLEQDHRCFVCDKNEVPVIICLW